MIRMETNMYVVYSYIQRVRIYVRIIRTEIGSGTRFIVSSRLSNMKFVIPTVDLRNNIVRVQDKIVVCW